jgi:hypothetical protein
MTRVESIVLTIRLGLGTAFVVVTIGTITSGAEFAEDLIGNAAVLAGFYALVLGLYLWERRRWLRRGFVTVRTDGEQFVFLHNRRVAVVMGAAALRRTLVLKDDWLTIRGFEDVLNITRMHGAYGLLRKMAAL